MKGWIKNASFLDSLFIHHFFIKALLFKDGFICSKISLPSKILNEGSTAILKPTFFRLLNHDYHGWVRGVAESVKRLLLTLKVSGSNPREAQLFSKQFWLFLGYIISSVHSTRRTRAIGSRFNREIVIASCTKSLDWGSLKMTPPYNHYWKNKLCTI